MANCPAAAAWPSLIIRCLSRGPSTVVKVSKLSTFSCIVFRPNHLFSDFLIFSSLPMRPGIGRLPKPPDGQPAPSQDTCACMWSYLYSVTFSYTSLLPLCGPCKVPTSSKICVLQSSPLDLEHLAGMDQHLCHYNGLLTHLLPRGWYTDHLGSLPLIQSNCNLRLTTPCTH